jgi:hypothetical protein
MMLWPGTISPVVLAGTDCPAPAGPASGSASAPPTGPRTAGTWLEADAPEPDALEPDALEAGAAAAQPASSRQAPDVTAATDRVAMRSPARDGAARILVFMLVGRTRPAPGSGSGDNRQESAN